MHVIATAGHVDHGKSTLVRALTDMEPDRWAEEQARGMTIDLGYAWTTLSNGAQVAFVDVPGHRKFVTNMLAGVGSVPAVLLVVAADEGWCQQTAEHLQAVEALGIRHGVLAITRADLGDAELAEEEARDHLADTGLADVEAVAVSPVARTGLDDLRAALGRLTDAMPVPPDYPTRLWVDRAFSIRGTGTVVTGTLSTGSVHTDHVLEVTPSGERVRIRSIETLKRPVREIGAVARVALNLRGVRLADIERGAALVAPDGWAITSTFDVRLVQMSSRLPAQAVCHIGSAAVTARVRPLGTETARLTLARPVPIRIGDRALLRQAGQPGITAGVIVLDPYPPALQRRGAARLRGGQLAAMRGHPDAAAEVLLRGVVRRDQLVKAGALKPDAPCPSGAVEVHGWLVAGIVWNGWRNALAAAADTWAASRPMRPGLPVSAAVEQLDLPDPSLLAPLVAEDPELVADREGVHRASVQETLPPEAQSALDELIEHLSAHPFAAREVAQLAQAGLGQPQLAAAVKRGQLVNLGDGVYVRPEALDHAMRVLGELPQPFTASAARQALDTTRRVALPLLEELDRRRLTRRVDSQLRSLVS